MTSDADVRRQAEAMYRSDVMAETGETTTRPEVNELKETGYWQKARAELNQSERGRMTNEHFRGRRENIAGHDATEEFARRREEELPEASAPRATAADRLRGMLGMGIHRAGQATASGVRAVPTGVKSYVKHSMVKRQRKEALKRQAIEQRRKAYHEEITFAKQAVARGRRQGIYEAYYEAGRRTGKKFAPAPRAPSMYERTMGSLMEVMPGAATASASSLLGFGSILGSGAPTPRRRGNGKVRSSGTPTRHKRRVQRSSSSGWEVLGMFGD